MKYLFLITAIFLITHSCNQKNPVKPVQNKEDLHPESLPDTETSTMIQPLADSIRNNLLESAMMNGDKDAYSKVSNSEPFLGPGLLFQALVMANKYNDSAACYDVYYMLCEEGYNSFSLDFGTVDKKSTAIGLYYLLKSYELGFSDARDLIKDKYIDKHLPVPKSSDFLIFK